MIAIIWLSYVILSGFIFGSIAYQQHWNIWIAASCITLFNVTLCILLIRLGIL